MKINKLKNDYKNNGYIIIKNFFSKKKISSIKKEIINNLKKKKYKFYYEKINKINKLRRIEKIGDFSINTKKLIKSRDVINTLKILENNKYVLFKDKLNFKFPGGKGFLPHIDGHFFWEDENKKYNIGWKKYSENFVNLVIPLEKTNKKNGCLLISKKKYTDNFGSDFKNITKKLILNTPNIKKKDFNKFKFKSIEMNVGDILIFNWKCAHYSKKNYSKNSRMIFYVTYSKYNKRYGSGIRNLYYKEKKSSKNNEQNKSLLFV